MKSTGPNTDTVRGRDFVASRRGLAYALILVVLLVVVLLAGGGFLLQRGGDTEGSGAPDIFTARRGSFDITVPASGELAALSQIEIASQLETRAVITEIAAEGTTVRKGDLLIQLDDKDILDRIKDAEVSVKNAETSWTTAQSNLEIRIASSASQLTLADVDIKLADLAIKAWRQGSDVARKQQLSLDVVTNLKNYDRLVARHEANKELLAQQFISQDEFDRDEIEMMRSSSSYEQAKLAKEVYEAIEREQEIEKLNAALKKARDQRAELAQRNANEINQLETEVENRLVALRREQERLDEARAQHERCTINAPQDGLVVYTASLQTGGHRGGNEDPPDIGTELRRNRTVIVLPNTSKMVAEVKINEALSGKIRPGQRAVIYSDAIPDTPLEGEVLSVGVLAESGGWRDPNRRDYTVRIALVDGNEHGLKPSMRCRANIYVGRVDDAAYVPIQAVFRQGSAAFTYSPDGSGFAQRLVTVGRSSELFIEILDGIEEGDEVLLREPPAERITSQLKVEAGGQARPASLESSGRGSRRGSGAGPEAGANASPAAGAPDDSEAGSAAGPEAGASRGRPSDGGGDESRRQGRERPARPAGAGKGAAGTSS